MLEHRVPQGLKVLLVRKVHREMSALKGRLVLKVLQALLDLRVHKEIPAHKELLELKDYREM